MSEKPDCPKLNCNAAPFLIVLEQTDCFAIARKDVIEQTDCFAIARNDFVLTNCPIEKTDLKPYFCTS